MSVLVDLGIILSKPQKHSNSGNVMQLSVYFLINVYNDLKAKTLYDTVECFFSQIKVGQYLCK